MSTDILTAPPMVWPDKARVRRDDAVTSHEAADSNDTAASRTFVMFALIEHGMLAQFELEQIADGLRSPSRIRTAVSELVERGAGGVRRHLPSHAIAASCLPCAGLEGRRMSAELEALIERAALEAVEAHKAIQRERRKDQSRGTPELRAYSNEYQREWRRIRIEVDPEYREIERAKFRHQYRENPEAWRRARIERENARAKTPGARAKARHDINQRRATDPAFRERERARDRRRYHAKKEASNV